MAWVEIDDSEIAAGQPVTDALMTKLKDRDEANHVSLTLGGVGGIPTAIIPGDGTAPLAPTALSADAAFHSIILQWTNSASTDLVGTEVWGASVNNRSSAIKLATVPFPQTIWAEEGLATNVTRYYWVRHTDRDSLTSAYFPASSTAGISATTASLSITTTDITDNSISTPKLQANSVTAAKIVAGTITADKLNVTSLSAVSATMGTVTGGTFQTAASGTRVAVDTSGGFRSYDSGGSVVVQVAGGTGVQAMRVGYGNGIGAPVSGSAQTGIALTSIPSVEAYTSRTLRASFGPDTYLCIGGTFYALSVDGSGFVKATATIPQPSALP